MSESGLILPAHIQEGRQNLSPPPPPSRLDISPEMMAQVKPYLSHTIEINTLLASVLTGGEPAFIALLAQPAIQQLIVTFMNGVAMQIVQQVVQKDRNQVFSVVNQVRDGRNQEVNAGMGKLDMNSYNIAVQDLKGLLSQVPPPQINFPFNFIQIPTEDLAPTSSEPVAPQNP